MKKILMLAFATMMTFVAGAQDFGQDKVVNAPTTWTFEHLFSYFAPPKTDFMVS